MKCKQQVIMLDCGLPYWRMTMWTVAIRACGQSQKCQRREYYPEAQARRRYAEMIREIMQVTSERRVVLLMKPGCDRPVAHKNNGLAVLRERARERSMERSNGASQCKPTSSGPRNSGRRFSNVAR